MTLNLSHRPIFPANLSEDSLVSSVRIANSYILEGNPEKNSDKPQQFNWEIENFFDYGRVGADRGGSWEPVTNENLELLPVDPFGMGMGVTLSAITGWVEGFETNGLNIVWNTATRLHPELICMGIHDRSNLAGGFDGYMEEKKSWDRRGLVCNVEEFLNLNYEKPGEGTGSCSDGDGGDPHEAFFFALGYLGVKDLLSAERVCKSFRSAVQSDVLLWKSIHIDWPLSERITDDALLVLTNRAQGKLQCLSLVGCSRITDDGLKRVLENNPRLTKLNVPRCTRLSVDGIVNNLKAFKCSSIPGINHLRISGLYGLTHRHFEELKSLVGSDKCTEPNVHKPHFYHNRLSSALCDDDRAIDIEICPRCQNLKLVYDCPTESCQGKQTGTQQCRACIICIERCAQCGRCINESEYEETFCLDLLCLDCWKQLHQCQEICEEKGAPQSKHTIFHHETKYFLSLHG